MWIKFLVKLISLLHDDIDDIDYNGDMCLVRGFLSDFYHPHNSIILEWNIKVHLCQVGAVFMSLSFFFGSM